MILRFRANQVREQISHARKAARHRALSQKPALEPSLHLVKTRDQICLVSSGLPESGQVASRIAIEPGEQDMAIEEQRELVSAAADDFVEAIALDAFTKPLARNPQDLDVVLTASYINVLGGQPERAKPSLPPAGRHR